MDFNSGEINLLNPLTRTQISLPHISTFTNPPKPNFDQERNEIWYIKKAIISTSPSTTGAFFVMVIFTNLWALAFCRAGEEKWTTLIRECGPCEDLIYYRDKLYAITYWGAVIAWDLHDSTKLHYFRYLVESPNGELLKISKLENENGCTIGFKVYRLVDQVKKNAWVEINSLGDYAVLGYNQATCLSTKENPECLVNCIYFAEDNTEILLSRWMQ